MVSLLLLSFAVSSTSFIQAHEEKSFLSWMRQTNSFFTGDEYHFRLGIFLANKRFVQEHNSKSTFKVGLNKFAALTPSEYSSMLGFRMKIGQISGQKIDNSMKIMTPNDNFFDWRSRGVVNEMKDQGQCGSCWAFSAIQAAESINAIKTGKLEKYSEQNLLDCNRLTGYGCNGGRMDDSYDFIVNYQDGKFNLDSEYPYVAVQNPRCYFDDHQKVGSLSSFLTITQYDEYDLQSKVEKYGPAAVAIDSNHRDFMLYTSGIYENKYCSFIHLDHGMGVIGHGIEGGTHYWIVRNSWGTAWGEGGYVRMIHKYNICGIATCACIPVA